MRVMKRTVMLFAACVTAALAMAQDDNTLVNNNAIDAPQTSIEYEEDTTEIMTIDEIVNEQMDVNNRVSKERHMEDVWGRRSYLNLSYSSAKLTPQQTIPTGVDNGIVPAYNTSWGLSLTIGRSYRLHKPAIANILQFNIDYTWLDFNLNHFDHENNGKNLYDSSSKRTSDGKSVFHLPWNLEKYELSYGMALGPSITISPFTNTNSKGAHYLKFNIYYHLGYHVSGLLMANDENADRNTDRAALGEREQMSDNTKITWGHGVTNAIGLSLVWKTIGIGYEHRGSTVKYKPIATDDFGKDTYEFKMALNRIFIQFRM